MNDEIPNTFIANTVDFSNLSDGTNLATPIFCNYTYIITIL